MSRQNPSATCAGSAGWPLERALFAMAGSVTLVTAVLAVTISPWILLMTGFTGVSQLLYVAFGACPASLALKRLFGLQSVVYPKSGEADR